MRIIVVRMGLAGLLLAGTVPAGAQQVADSTFSPVIESPEYEPASGPRVVIDAAHLNFHTADGGYAPFANLLRFDGYVVEANHAPFSAPSLERVDILVIANAMHETSEADWAPLPSLSAFEDAEIVAVEQWVRAGGSLLLIADHMPLAGHAEVLAAAFGIRFQNGFALDASGRGQITFRRSDGSLSEHAIVHGRNPGESVDFVTTFTGQAFRVDARVEADPLLILSDRYELLLPPVAWEFSDSTPRIPAAGLLQGAVLRHGQGRVAVFGEAAMFTAQRAGPDKVAVGMNAADARQNGRFALNVLLWLSNRLVERGP